MIRFGGVESSDGKVTELIGTNNEKEQSGQRCRQ
jgi:hypothetical protein